MNDAAIDHYLNRWSLSRDGAGFETPSSWIQPVQCGQGAAMLKLLKPTSDEHNASDLLRHYDGRGAVRLFAADADAHLVERASGPRSLLAMATSGQDDEAAAVLADALAVLHRDAGRPAPGSLTPLAEQFSALFHCRDRHALLPRCAAVARDLLADPLDCVPLHGDLHHRNVLDGGARGWLAIDPKALLGERAYDVANLLCNPSPHGDLVHSQARMERLGDFYARHLGLDTRRVLRFAFAHAGLSASWDIEDGFDPTYSLTCAETLAPLVAG